MPSKDPYEVLGVPRNAKGEDIRKAFRKAALKYHPDSTREAPDVAETKIKELIYAYQLAIAALAAGPGTAAAAATSRTYSPSDFARHGYQTAASSATRIPMTPDEIEQELASLWSKHKSATRNEPLWFALFWVVAVLVGIAVGIYTGFRMMPHGEEAEGTPPSTWHVVLMIALAEAIYAALAFAAGYLILLTRRLVKLTVQYAARRWMALPAPRDQNPREREENVR
jgi:hypothetical protein